MDKNTKILVGFMISVIVVILVVAVFGVLRLEKKIDWCDEKNGLVVKTIDGWACINAKKLEK